MRSRMSTFGFALRMALYLITVMCWFAVAINAEAADDPAKQIERILSKVKRDIVTSPSRAEKGFLEAREMLKELENSDPRNAKIPSFQKNIEQLGQKLEKRLGRPIGASAPEEKRDTAAQKQKSTQTAVATTAASGLPSSVTSALRKINADLDAVEAALPKGQMQTAVNKLKTAQKKMDEIQNRYGDKISDDNLDMKTGWDRLVSVAAKVNQVAASAAEMADAEAAKKKQKEAQSQEWIDRFAPFVDPKSDSFLLMGAQFNSASKAEQEKCRQAYSRANALMAEYKATAFPYGKTQARMLQKRRISS